MANEMRTLSDAEVDAVAGGWTFSDVLVSSVVAPTIATDDRGENASREKK
jgi:hypothetical protein